MNDMQTIIKTAQAFAQKYPDTVFIGGLATYLYTINSELIKDYAQASHDIDLCISLNDFAMLQDDDSLMLTRNPRLGKMQIVNDGIAIDVYLERNSDLIIDYAEIATHATSLDGVYIASVEHLLVLKEKAYRDRQGSVKGDKDLHDMVKIMLASDVLDSKQLQPHFFTPTDFTQALAPMTENQVYLSLFQNNAHLAKRAKQHITQLFQKLTKGWHE